MNYYNEIKNTFINNKIYKKVKDYSKNKNDLETNYKVGKLLNEAGKCYGENIIKEYSIKLSSDLGIIYDVSTLNKMRKFYTLIEKMATMSPKLSYSHYVELLPYDDLEKVKYYIKIVENQNLSVRQLRTKIKSNEYERLPEETKNKLILKEELDTTSLIKNPIQVKNDENYEVFSEKVLQRLILEEV